MDGTEAQGPAHNAEMQVVQYGRHQNVDFNTAKKFGFNFPVSRGIIPLPPFTPGIRYVGAIDLSLDPQFTVPPDLIVNGQLNLALLAREDKPNDLYGACPSMGLAHTHIGTIYSSIEWAFELQQRYSYSHGFTYRVFAEDVYDKLVFRCLYGPMNETMKAYLDEEVVDIFNHNCPCFFEIRPMRLGDPNYIPKHWILTNAYVQHNHLFENPLHLFYQQERINNLSKELVRLAAAQPPIDPNLEIVDNAVALKNEQVDNAALPPIDPNLGIADNVAPSGNEQVDFDHDEGEFDSDETISLHNADVRNLTSEDRELYQRAIAGDDNAQDEFVNSLYKYGQPFDPDATISDRSEINMEELPDSEDNAEKPILPENSFDFENTTVPDFDISDYEKFVNGDFDNRDSREGEDCFNMESIAPGNVDTSNESFKDNDDILLSTENPLGSNTVAGPSKGPTRRRCDEEEEGSTPASKRAKKIHFPVPVLEDLRHPNLGFFTTVLNNLHETHMVPPDREQAYSNASMSRGAETLPGVHNQFDGSVDGFTAQAGPSKTKSRRKRAPAASNSKVVKEGLNYQNEPFAFAMPPHTKNGTIIPLKFQVKCPKCTLICRMGNGFDRHEKECSGDYEKELKKVLCRYCGVICNGTTGNRVHQQKCSLQDKKELRVCEKCGGVFTADTVGWKQHENKCFPERNVIKSQGGRGKKGESSNS